MLRVRDPNGKYVTCLKIGKLLSVQRKDLRTVMDLLSVREHHARTLLIYYRWDVEKLTAVYVEKGRSCMFSEAGVSVVEVVDLDPAEPSSTMMCNICIDDVPVKDITKMDCGHYFCNNCKHLYFHLLLSKPLFRSSKNERHNFSRFCYFFCSIISL